MRNQRLILLAPLLILPIVGFQAFGSHESQELKHPNAFHSASERQPNSKTKFIQLVIQLNTPEQSSMAEDVLHFIAKRVRPHHFVEVSNLAENGVNVIYSKAANRRAIQGLRRLLDGDSSTPNLDPIPSDEADLVKAVQRFSDRLHQLQGKEPIYLYLVSAGTSNPQIIAQIKAICESIPQEYLTQAYLYAIGLSPENRLPMASGFAAIGSHVEFAGQEYSEWIQLIRKF